MNLSASKIKISRQLSLALTPEAARLMRIRPYPPGEHGAVQKGSRKLSDYKRQLSAKLLYLPPREEVPVSCDISLVIEYYAR